MSTHERRTGSIGSEAGAVAIIVAFGLVAFLGLAALVVDLGLVYHTKRELQTAADAGALAGAWELPAAPTAKSVASEYVDKNDLQALRTATTPYNGDAMKIEVVCTRTVPFAFARVIGHDTSKVTARAVAGIDKWSGEALPFINMDEDYLVDPLLDTWWKIGQVGEYESLWNDDYDIINGRDPATVYFDVHWEDGAQIRRGLDNSIKTEVGDIYDRGDDPVYILSLSSAVLRSGQVLVWPSGEQGVGESKYVSLTNGFGDLKNKDVIDRSQIVLLECTFDYWNPQGNGPQLKLGYVRVYDIANGEFPPPTVTLIE